MIRYHVLVCGGTGCTSANSAAIIERMEKELGERGLNQEIAVVQTGCFGLCGAGPIMIVYPDQVLYSMVEPDDIPEIIDEHLVKGRLDCLGGSGKKGCKDRGEQLAPARVRERREAVEHRKSCC